MALLNPLADGAVVTTSGSTGAPKRVVLSAAAFRASAAAANAQLGEPGTWILALPTTYVAGLNVVARALAMGGEPRTATGGPSFSALGFAAVVAGVEGPAYTSLVPVQLARLLDSAPGRDALARLDRVLLGGQAPDPALLARAAEAGARVTVTYGASETCGGVVWDGVPIGDTRVEIVDGRIHVAGATLADGYADDPAATAEAFPVVAGVRMHRTNDLGELVAGRLTVLGRADDVYVSGGVKVSLGAVAAAARDAGAADAAAVAVAHEPWGEASVVVTSSAVDERALRDAIAARLGAAARPVAVVRVDAVPLTEGGKPDRRALAELAAAAVPRARPPQSRPA